jgi:hypothetical protein
MRQCKSRRHIFAMSNKPNVLSEAGTPDRFLKLTPVIVPSLRVSGQNQYGVSEPVLVTQPPYRLDR